MFYCKLDATIPTESFLPKHLWSSSAIPIQWVLERPQRTVKNSHIHICIVKHLQIMTWRLGSEEGRVERWLGRHFQDSLELNSQLCTEASYSCFGVPASNMQKSLVFLPTELPLTDLTTVVMGPITQTLILDRTSFSKSMSSIKV